MEQQTMKIGEVATRANVNIQTLRYYERRGLLPKAPRTGSNYRLYSEEYPAGPLCETRPGARLLAQGDQGALGPATEANLTLKRR